MKDTRTLRLAGILGAIGMFVGILADVASGYSLQGSERLTSVYSVSEESVYPLLSSKPHRHYVLGHYVDGERKGNGPDPVSLQPHCPAV